MWLFGTGVGLLVSGGGVGLLGRRRLVLILSSLLAMAGCLLASISAIQVLVTGQSWEERLAAGILWADWSVGMDALSAVFVVPISIVVAAASWFSIGYLDGAHYLARRAKIVCWFHLLAASMLLVVTARNGLFFLMAWEGMSLASFFLVLTEHERVAVRLASWIYLIAMHLGAASLWVLFLLLGRGTGSLDFAQFSAASAPAGVVFVLALVGFGTKAGIVPFHVWLPEAHPAGPSHVSAVMSGVMIKTGIYGLLRILSFFDEVPAWWGWTLISIGVVSALFGIVFALAQSDLKRLLAYCSVENVGIIVLAIGVGLLGVSHRHAVMALLGFTGALLHVINHALYKSLLFLAAGSVQMRAGTLDMNRLGGLLRQMPITGAAFLLASCAIAGLPPLNGFVSELAIFLGILSGLVGGEAATGLARIPLAIVALGGLALVGGLASICFSKAFGGIFLGTTRSAEAECAREVSWVMYSPTVVLAVLCVAVSVAAPVWPAVLNGAVRSVMAVEEPGASAEVLTQVTAPFTALSVSMLILLLTFVGLAWLRRRLLSSRGVERSVTWDCGYAQSVPRAQYTPDSFVQPVVTLLRLLLRPTVTLRLPGGLFPTGAEYRSRVGDLLQQHLYRPVFLALAWSAAGLRRLNQGRIQLYVLYIALTILTLLIWKMD